MDFSNRFLPLLAILACFPTPLSSLRITWLSVPRRVALGNGAKLECDWAAEGQRIYSLKWYFGLKEFYRWTPADPDPIQVFAVSAFKVDKQRSSRGEVVLRDLTRQTEGFMRCEITAEAPTFHTTTKAMRIQVVEIPRTAPSLSPIQKSYQMHEELKINCTSHQSNPAATLSFFINNQPVNMGSIAGNWNIESHQRGIPLFTAIKELRFFVRPQQMDLDNRVALKCVAEITDVYWQTAEVRLAVDMPQSSSIMEDRSAAGGLKCSHLLLSSILLIFLALI